jgi:hypothetical protein
MIIIRVNKITVRQDGFFRSYKMNYKESILYAARSVTAIVRKNTFDKKHPFAGKSYNRAVILN